MSFLTGESLKSSSDSDSPRISSPLLINNNNLISNSDSTLTSCSPAKGQQPADDNRLKTKREVYKYETDWLVSSVAWSNDDGDSFELAVGSFIENYQNFIHIVTLSKDSFDEEIRLFKIFNHPKPPTKISWIPKTPNSTGQLPRLIATSGDYLRIWRIPPNEFNSNKQQNGTSITNNNNVAQYHNSSSTSSLDVKQECSLGLDERNWCHSPVTSFDWNEIDTRILVTSSVDTTCSVWDIEMGEQISSTNQIDNSTSNNNSGQLKNQILASDHEIYDVSFSRQGSGRDIFVTACGDGSLRLFDLRMLSTSTVLYETSDDCNHNNGPPLVRVACNKQDSNYVSTFATSSNDIVLVDVRKAGTSIAKLSSHSDILNGISWAPHSAHHLCSASDDSRALIWGLSNMDEPEKEPLLAYKAGSKINAISWSSSHTDWIAIGFENNLELLRV